MRDFIDKSVLLWDFDGVILDSMPIREYGFKKVLEKYPNNEVEELLDFHEENAGLSRYVKFRYFFKEIRNEALSEEKLSRLTDSYSEIMREKLCLRKNLISETINYIKKNRHNYTMHIVSGSDENELSYLCNQLSISQYFKSIEGSPTPKIELVRNLIEKFNYTPKELCLIGDSKNDLEAAESNKIDFFGYNNKSLMDKGKNYIISFP
ncbi:HAD hydrolase-like protein [Salegentibacter sp. LM13S]|uniref:HAD family hydrolase n=1 Tax=Salegentibacter lacus TaxID=2873599 RepID=UPI001CCF1C3E|nr:HAD hydrolase-like protein [Salegentibacter lacus]MBZ9631473.1 HAD hydrolase-like protein [Salegentibacter lacus]